MTSVTTNAVYADNYGWYSSKPTYVTYGEEQGTIIYRYSPTAGSTVTALSVNVSWYSYFSLSYDGSLDQQMGAYLIELDENGNDVGTFLYEYYDTIWFNTPGSTSGTLNISFSNLNVTIPSGHYLGVQVYWGGSYGGRTTFRFTTPSSANVTYAVAAPTITAQPSNVSVGAGNTATFSVTASGSGLSYQWYRTTVPPSSSSYGEETLIVEEYEISGATSRTYSFTASSSDNGYYYRCRVYNSGGSVYSDYALLTIVSTPTISSHPSSKSVYIGQSVTFSVSASGSGTLSYQWKYSTDGSNWSSISGATSSSYTISSATSSMNGRYYRCSVTNSGGTTDSNYATLTVYAKPTITSQPSARTVGVGHTASFSVTATGQSLSYQWQYSDDAGSTWSNLSGKTSSSYSVTASTSINNRRFRCVVTNDSGSVNSSSAKLTVVAAPTISKHPTSQTTLAGETVYFSVTASGQSLTYQWMRLVNNIWQSITGANESSYSVEATSALDGAQYRCSVYDSYNDAVWSDIATLTVYSPLTLTPATKTVTAGTAVSYTIGNRHDETVNVKCYYGGTTVKTISSQTTDSFSVTFGNDLCKQYGVNQLVIDIIVTAPLLNRQATATLTVNEDTSAPPTITVEDFHPVKKSGATDSTFADWIKDYSRAYFKISVTTSGSSTVAENGVVLSYPGGTSVIATQQNSTTYYALTEEPLSTAPVTLTMTVTDTNGNTATATQTVSALADSSPTMGTISVTPLTSSNPANFPNAWIAGRTKAVCAVAVSSPFDFTIKTVTLSFPNGTTVSAKYNSTSGKWEGTTAEPVPDNVTFTMTATDANGTASSNTKNLTGVITYTEPYVTVNTPVRCDTDGTSNAGGNCCKLTVTQHYCTALSGNSVEKLTAGVKGGTAVNVTSGTSATVSGLAIPTAAYVLELIIQDKVSSEVKKYLVVEGQTVNTNPNKVICNGDTLIDLTGDTVVHAKLKHGVVAIDKSGSKILGTVITRSGSEIKIVDGSVVIPAGFYSSDITLEISS